MGGRYIALSTWKKQDTKLHCLARFFDGFMTQGLIETMDPRKMREREIGVTGGNVFQGNLRPNQLFFMRSVPG